MYKLNEVIESIRGSVKYALNTVFSNKMGDNKDLPDIEIELPSDPRHGNLSTNAALIYAKILKFSPRKISEEIVNTLQGSLKNVSKIEIAGPGFINFFLDDEFFAQSLLEIKSLDSEYGKSDYGKGKRVIVEFVSANPTGPMHIGNARGGALGDCLAEILKVCGYDVYKEFYVNDAGNQIEKFGESLNVRYLQLIEGENAVQMPENGYQGDDIKELAKEFFAINGDKYVNAVKSERIKALIDYSLPRNIKRMQDDMKKYKILYDNWFYESELHKNGKVLQIVDIMKNKDLTYEKDGCLWYKATDFGSSKDEVLIRSNGIPTYFAADIAYHYNKLVTRKFDKCINLWGADHHGHVERMKGAMEALGIDRSRLDVVLYQLVRLVKNGEIVKMSKRTGKSIQLSDLLDEVSVDSARFIFNSHEPSSDMDFDLDLAVAKDFQNPVYYVQYAHARICSILRKYGENDFSNVNFKLLSTDSEKNMMYFMFEYPAEILRAGISHDPTKITRYVISLATLFHKFYSSNKVISEDAELTKARVFLCCCVKIIIKNVLDMFKISCPERMNGMP